MTNKYKYSAKSIQDFITLIEGIDLSKYPIEEISRQLKKIVPIPRLAIQINRGEKIYRGRYFEKQIFTKPKDYSYNPHQTSIGRANLKDTTCFYGCLESHLIDANISVIYELGLKEKMNSLPRNTFHHSKIAISCWEFTEDIMVELSGFNCSDYQNIGADYDRLCKKYYNELKDYYNDQDYKIVMKYFKLIGTEFIKRVAKNDFEFLISAIYAQDAMSDGLSGIAYPSKQANGKIMNVAINPSIADSKLKFKGVVGIDVHSYNKSTVMNLTRKSLPFPENKNEVTGFITYKEYEIDFIRELLIRKHNDFLKLVEKHGDFKNILDNYKGEQNMDGSFSYVV